MFEELVMMLFFFFILGGIMSPLNAEIASYPAPPGIAGKVADFHVTVNGREVFVYDSPVAAFAIFSFDKTVEVAITTTRHFQRVDIRPLSRGIQPTISGKSIRFSLDKPGNFSIELDGDIRRPLYLFANPLETDVPQSGQSGVRYFEGGKIHEAGEITLKDGETVYIAGGAVVRGVIRAKEAENIRILGRGILDGMHRDKKMQMVALEQCSNVELEGITIRGSYGWTIVPRKCQDVRIRNVKLVGWRDNDDGIDVVSSRDVSIDDCFLRTKDDCIAIKAFGDKTGSDDVEHVRVKNTVLWNAEWGNALEIGFELRTSGIRDVQFENCDIIHVERGGTFTIHNGDWATIEDIRYDDIRVEDSRDKLVDFWVGLSIYSGDCPYEFSRMNPKRKRSPLGQWIPESAEELAQHLPHRGCIRNVHFRNIKVLGPELPRSILHGFGPDHDVSEVVFENVTFQGKEILDAKSMNLTVEETRNLTFR